MTKLRLLLAVNITIGLLSCRQNGKPTDRIYTQQYDSCLTLSHDIVGCKDSLHIFECSLVKNIAQNLTDSRDSLYDIYKRTAGVSIDSLGYDAWLMNFWYGGSYEDIFVYKKNKTGSYSKIMSLCGTIGFKIQRKSDHGLRRIMIKEKRNQKSVIFFYDGSDYSNYYDNGIKRSLMDSIGVTTLEKMEIYNQIGK